MHIRKDNSDAATAVYYAGQTAHGIEEFKQAKEEAHALLKGLEEKKN